MLNEDFFRSATLLFVLLNPFFISVYLLDLIQDLPWPTFAAILLRAATISTAVFIVFALVGDAFFSDVLQVRFAAFLLFGGIVFLIVSVRSFFVGADALREMRGKAQHVAGSVAMPFMIGPGTVSASVSAGSHLPAGAAALAIVIPVFVSAAAVLVLKRAHDLLHGRNEAIVIRYVDVTGRIMALVTGTIAVEMILRGIEIWLGESP